MATSADIPDVETLWYELDPAALRCFSCQRLFVEDAIVRTFTLATPPGNDGRKYRCSRAVATHLERDILFFDRHMECLLATNTKYMAISHVWDPQTAITQQQGRHSPQPLDVRRITVEAPCRVFDGLEADGIRDCELWHDYFSVPQWSDELKSRILVAIPKIYSSAQATILHLSDLDPAVIAKLRNGTTTEERLAGITGLCNAKWFRRTWTAMEFVRSDTVRTMMADYRLDGDAEDPAFLNKAYDVWDKEVRDHGSVHVVEDMINLQKNRAPWNLGPLREVKALGRTNFAQAFALLSRRRCRDEMDFLHALRGIVSGGSEKPLGPNFREEYPRIARGCLLAGDYSPLLITPLVPALDDPRQDGSASCGYNDVWSWELGEETSPSSLPCDLSFDEVDDSLLSMSLEKIGVISTLRFPNWDSIYDHFSRCAMFTLELTGPSVDDFVTTLGTRLYGEDREVIMSHLKAHENLGKLKEALEEQFNFPWVTPWSQVAGDQEDGAQELARILSLTTVTDGQTENRVDLSYARAATMHCTPYNYLAGITCTTCHETFAFRVGAFAPASELHRATAYRIPGLKYRMSHADGVGLLVKDERVVGRMMWATPACACRKTEVVKLRMPELPLLNPQDDIVASE
ncbi:uncharacterized protein DNG_03156 [Cephalotrichum gorgonifer]|uniref:Heterokaryon incompatibility domain-containing protein n=1 Tax=Cephalotrichum gorgonifer TaxID=2041049 RepID=A0AAE8MTQ1_9PEZI|nr:uncharacterized protein DNG_03156 [Cephalotrichum gorgonifer]